MSVDGGCLRFAKEMWGWNVDCRDCLLLGRNRCKDEAINHVGLGFVNNTGIRADCDGCLHFKPRRVSVDGLPRLQRNNASLPRFARLNKLRKECVAALAFVPARFLRKQKNRHGRLHGLLHVFSVTRATLPIYTHSCTFSSQPNAPETICTHP